jgi:hypothetical protein
MNEEKILNVIGMIVFIPFAIMATPTILFIKIVNRLHNKKVSILW